MFRQPTNCECARLANVSRDPGLFRAEKKNSLHQSTRSQAGKQADRCLADNSLCPTVAAAAPPLGLVQSVYLYYMFSTGWSPCLSEQDFWTPHFWQTGSAGPDTHATTLLTHTNAMWLSYCAQSPRCPRVCLLLQWWPSRVNLPVCDCFDISNHCPYLHPPSLVFCLCGCKIFTLPATFLSFPPFFPSMSLFPTMLVHPCTISLSFPGFPFPHFSSYELAIGVLAKCRSRQEAWTLGAVQVLEESPRLTGLVDNVI